MPDRNALKIYGNRASRNLILQLTDEHDLALMDKEAEAAAGMCGHNDFALAAVPVADWNQDLTPWKAGAVFGKTGFGDGAAQTLQALTGSVLPRLAAELSAEERRCFLCGYSLAGLFALWAGYQTDLFSGIIAVSPSVWFPGWTDYAGEHAMRAGRVYLSLGDKEEKTKNPVMAAVGNAIRQQHSRLQEAGVHTVLEWNPGNHFRDSEVRTAKGIAWMLKQFEKA